MREAFPDLDVHTHHGRTELSGELADQPALFSVLDRLQELGLDLIGVSLDDDRG